MRDLRPTDKLAMCHGKPCIITDYPDDTSTTEWIVFDDIKDKARWWTRQAELRLDINIPREEKLVFAAILNK